VTQGAGNGLAGALERVVEGLREDEELEGTVSAELASARATGRLLAALPVLGVAGAAALGTPPVELLLGSSLGRICTVAAGGLEICGLLWLRRLAASVG
jgi:tight adherence protein B